MDKVMKRYQMRTINKYYSIPIYWGYFPSAPLPFCPLVSLCYFRSAILNSALVSSLYSACSGLVSSFPLSAFGQVMRSATVSTYSGVTTWDEVRQLPHGAKRQVAPLNSFKIICAICCSILFDKFTKYSQELSHFHRSSNCIAGR